jgi:hypothetical protein
MSGCFAFGASWKERFLNFCRWSCTCFSSAHVTGFFFFFFLVSFRGKVFLWQSKIENWRSKKASESCYQV